jgi:phage/plasmid-like protein (TIGR03299 family)
MPHELETVGGQTFFADSREDAWHQLGQKVGRNMDAAEVMEFSHLGGWDVRKVPLAIPFEPIIGPDGVTTPPPLQVPDKFATIRTNPINGATEYLGVVGTKYEPVQNEASTTLLDTIVDESGAHFETAGSLRGGRQTFVTMKLPNVMEIVGANGTVDRTEWYLAALNSHDGTSSWRVLLTPVRIVCANTQAWAESQARSSFSIRHSGDTTANIAEARRILGITWKSIGVIDEEFRRMSEIPVAHEEAVSFANKLVKLDVIDDPTSTKARNRANVAGAIVNLFENSPTIQPIAGTRFALYNAVTEYVDHFAPVRRGDEATVRALRTIRDAESTTSLKALAFKQLQVA